ncbi:MAG: dTMP kinase [Gemmatimonadales bacterium]|jgi:dTMP kinase|nr:dTMP kinase [Gemmatimonadales bacterium]MBT3499447.1 dTMP kinase [Gemmatimonadales bacterium]MBT3775852.1 dTMP kinase [Gemmatimonadales bacterium]MBT3959051.1 dTMP kinase [Gemmatimonadales bacterium]MBT4188925.1 dTMP kinase [Gemmatimonadales bacterium]
MRAGRFIVLEGGDGVGKSTQAALLSSFMDARGIPHVLTREPGGTPVGEAIRELLLGRADFDMPAETELLLMLAARATFVRDVVRPALAEGKVVLADRFSLSTLAYQGYGRGLDLDDVREAIRIATGGLDADLYVVLDLPAREGTARQQRDGMQPDRIEQAGDAFLSRVREGYLELAESEVTVRTVSARGKPEEVHMRIRELLARTFPETFGEDVV